MLNLIYERAKRAFESLTPEEQKAKEDELEGQGLKTDKEKTQAFIEQYTNPELFQAAMEGAKPSRGQEMGGLLGSALAGYGADIAGKSGAVARKQVYDQFRGMADRPQERLKDTQSNVMDYLDRQRQIKKDANVESRAAAGEERTAAKFETENQKRQNLADPDSEESKAYRALAAKLGLPNVPEGATALDLQGVLEPYSKMYGMDMQAELARLRNERASAREETRVSEKDASIRAKLDKETRDRMPKLRKELEPVQGVLTQIERIEQDLGSTLEEYAAKENKPDLPGVNVVGVGRVVMPWDRAGKNLQASVSSLYNRMLKEFSGAAVTTPEFNRFKEGMASGRFNTEGDMMKALLDLKNGIKQGFVNVEGAYDKSVVDAYATKEGSRTSRDFESPASSAEVSGESVRMTNGTKIFNIPADQVEEAKADGLVEVQ